MKTIMDIQKIMQSLPHRFPFLLLDKIVEIVPGESLVAIKNVTVNEPFFTGHFPGLPVMPGVLILEALAQACGVLSHQIVTSEVNKTADDYLYLFAGIDNARFKRIVVPGDQLRLSVKLARRKQVIWKFAAEATVEGELVCAAELVTAMKDKNRD